MSVVRRTLGLLFFGVLVRDVIRVGLLILMGLILSERGVNIVLLLTGSASMMAIFIYANIVNDISDLELDRKAKPYRPLPSGRYTVSEARNASVVSLLIAVGSLAVAMWLSFVPSLLVLLGLTAIGAHTYSWPPIRFKARSWLGVISISLIYVSPLVMGFIIGGVNAGNVPLLVLIFCGITLASSTKDFEDKETDEAMNVRTPPVVHGIQRTASVLKAAALLSLLIAIAAGGYYATSGRPWRSLFCLAMIPPFVLYYARLAAYSRSLDRERLLTLVQGGLWSFYVWPFLASAATILLPSII